MNELDKITLDEQVRDVQIRLAESGEPCIASLYHERSKRYRREQSGVPPVLFDFDILPAFTRRAFKEYRLAKRITLPEQQELDAPPLDTVILNRRTIRAFAMRQMTLYQISNLLGLSYRVINPADLADLIIQFIRLNLLIRHNESPRTFLTQK